MRSELSRSGALTRLRGGGSIHLLSLSPSGDMVFFYPLCLQKKRRIAKGSSHKGEIFLAKAIG